jgi:alkylated DNA repair dioxygenase AlkB
MQVFDCGSIEYLPDFLEPAEAEQCLSSLWRELAWAQREITLFGRGVMQPRLTAWYGEPEAHYSYSGLAHDPLPWHPLLLELKGRVEAHTGRHFNSVLANAYRDGRDSMGWHSDDEKELGPRPVIASLSFGATRRLLLRQRNRTRGERSKSIALVLEPGSLLLMKGDSQQQFQHALPRTRRDIGLRINLTYRLVAVQAPVWR